ncbi:MAG: PhzF family phenazine biosynthesis protein, partial [Planctomycetota bacterium]
MLEPREPARFHTRSGPLGARRNGDWIELDFPARPAAATEPIGGLIEAVGAAPVHVARCRDNWLLEYDGEQAVRSLRPDLAALRDLDASVIATCRSDGEPYDFVSRYFAPVYGIDEDPVTGSAHCTLGPWWRERLGRDTFTAYQASSRGGVVKVRLEGDRVHLGGRAVTVMRATLTETVATGAGRHATAA